MAVQQGVYRRFNTRRARELAQSFFAAYPKLPFITLEQFHLLEKHFKQGIAAYSVTNAGDFILTHHPSHYDKVSYPTMNVGIYESHAFLRIDINKVANNYTCGDCMARFTQASDLMHHAPRCKRGRTEIECPANQWFRKRCIHCFPNPEKRTKVICIDKKDSEITREAVYQRTLKRSEVIRASDYRLVERWEHEGRVPGGTTNSHRKETKRIHTRLSLTLKPTKTRQRQATRREIFLMKVSMFLSQSLSLTR